MQLFSAMRYDTAVVVAQVQVPADTTEVTEVAALLDPIDITGMMSASRIVPSRIASSSIRTQPLIPAGPHRGIGCGYVLPLDGAIVDGCAGSVVHQQEMIAQAEDLLIVDVRCLPGSFDGTDQRSTEEHESHQIRSIEVLSSLGNAPILALIDT